MTDAITADVSCSLLEFDFAGIEAVLTGFYLWRHGFSSEGARQYIRLSRLGMHAAVTGLKVGSPVDLTLDDVTVGKSLKAVKFGYPKEYDTAKRTVHANNFGMTTYGMVEKFPEFFPTIKSAEEFQSYYYALAPDLPKWHGALRRQAHDRGFLGGPAGTTPTIWDHPYGYRHWFWDVLSFQPCNEFTARKWLKDVQRAHRVVYLHGRPFKTNFGGDGNRVVAFYPQSTAAGRLKEAQAYDDGLFVPWSENYIGDVYFGRTPLCGPIHDSLLLHVPNRCVDRVVEIVARVMQRPSHFLPIPADWGWGDYLPIGVAAKAGKNWGGRITEDDQIKIQAKTGVKVPLNLDGMTDIEIPQWSSPAGQAEMIAHVADEPVLPRDADASDLEEWQLLQRSVA